MPEPRLLQDPRVHIILKMPEVKRNPDTIQTQSCKESGIGCGKEVFKPFVEEELVFLGPKHLAHCGSVLRFVPGVAGDEVFHAESVSCVSWEEGSQAYFIQPPMAAPRRITGWPFWSATWLPLTVSIPVAMLQYCSV